LSLQWLEFVTLSMEDEQLEAESVVKTL
jgi:hypothetical protein